VPVVVTVSVVLPDTVIVGEEKPHCGGEIGLGGPEVMEHERVTVPVKPFSALMLTVEVAGPD